MITQSKLKELLHYNPSTGVFTRKVTTGRMANKGDIAGTTMKNSNGKSYIVIRLMSKKYLAHRLAFLYMTGSFPKFVDHENGNGTDNRFENLRDVTHSENCKNMRMRSDNKTGVTGVRFVKSCQHWRSQLTYDGEIHYLGAHKTLFDAVCARKSMERRFPFHRNHGQVRDL